ncbi:hypothetical protein [Actinomadura rupiterrae]|uniref:hypothetical protein n=1 Tax=Actinomadura rupiterrae TaxID=559627 RepID=UPI0020A4C917|nr:hypothetical protein [Actinomadura rupiterrae]MCP2340217.1 hypothetical protein [Actinomadura rupiterrae]
MRQCDLCRRRQPPDARIARLPARKAGYAIVSFQFHYAIDPHSRAAVASAGADAFTTSVRVVG